MRGDRRARSYEGEGAPLRPARRSVRLSESESISISVSVDSLHRSGNFGGMVAENGSARAGGGQGGGSGGHPGDRGTGGGAGRAHPLGRSVSTPVFSPYVAPPSTESAAVAPTRAIKAERVEEGRRPPTVRRPLVGAGRGEGVTQPLVARRRDVGTCRWGRMAQRSVAGAEHSDAFCFDTEIVPTPARPTHATIHGTASQSRPPRAAVVPGGSGRGATPPPTHRHRA